jgi:hypothetical protein
MADLESLEKIWRQSLELNLRYYSTVGRLTVDYFKDLFAALSPLQAARSQPRPSTQPVVPAPPTPPASPASPPAMPPAMPRSPAAAAPAQQAGVMVLESEAGGQALGVFLVANNLGHEISAPVTASTFAAENGHTVQPAFIFDPAMVTLASGEQMLVRVVTVIDDSLVPEVRYRGEFTIPELAGTRIPIVLRRRPDQPEPPVEISSTVAHHPRPSGSSRRSRSTQARQTIGSREKSSRRKS